MYILRKLPICVFGDESGKRNCSILAKFFGENV